MGQIRADKVIRADIADCAIRAAKTAELIVMMGAVLEERGAENGMWKLIEKYKSLHSRKRAFRSEIDELAKMS